MEVKRCVFFWWCLKSCLLLVVCLFCCCCPFWFPLKTTKKGYHQRKTYLNTRTFGTTPKIGVSEKRWGFRPFEGSQQMTRQIAEVILGRQKNLKTGDLPMNWDYCSYFVGSHFDRRVVCRGLHWFLGVGSHWKLGFPSCIRIPVDCWVPRSKAAPEKENLPMA